jgi:hypothetical protein
LIRTTGRIRVWAKGRFLRSGSQEAQFESLARPTAASSFVSDGFLLPLPVGNLAAMAALQREMKSRRGERASGISLELTVAPATRQS